MDIVKRGCVFCISKQIYQLWKPPQLPILTFFLTACDCGVVVFLQIRVCTALKGSRIKPAKVRQSSSLKLLTLSRYSHQKQFFFSDDASTFSSGATSPTVYGVGGPPGGAVGSPGQKRSVSGTGNTLKVITDRTMADI